MTTMVERAESGSNARTDRYRAAERALWQQHGLEPTERWVELDQPRARLRITEVGSGPPVLFVPGTGGTGPYWAPLVARMPGVRCLMLDRPGWGLSSPIDWRTADYGSLAGDLLAAVLNALEIERVQVVGASIGGLWGLRLAERHPERLERLTMLGGFPNAEIPISRFFRLLTSPLGALMVRVPQSAKMQRSQLAAIGHGPTVDAGRMDGFINWRTAFTRQTPSMRHERSMAQAVFGRDAYRPGVTFDSASLTKIAHPVRMIFGSEDPTGSVDIWTRFIDALPHGELVTVEGAGHLAWWDDPQQVAEAVNGFLTR